MTTARLDTVLGNAAAFGRRGYGVLPLHWPVQRDGRLVCSCKKPRDCPSPAKHPYGPLAPNGLLSASTESGIIKGWFGYQVPDANYGVVTSDALFALDIDPRNSGNESLAALEREHGPLPQTWRTISGSGGEHVLFNAEGLTLQRGRARDVGLPTGIDAPNYIVGPGSRHICGRRYEWNVDCHPADVALAAPPPWLLARLAVHTTKEQRGVIAPGVWRRLTEHVREYPDAAAAQVAGHLLRRWVDPCLVAGLLHAWNQTYARPPLPDDQLRCILDRIARLEDQRRDALHGGERAKT